MADELLPSPLPSSHQESALDRTAAHVQHVPATAGGSQSIPKIRTPPKRTVASILAEVETTTEKEAYDRASDLIDQSERNYLELGGMLARIRDEQWFSGHASFKEYVNVELGITDRQARYYIEIYTAVKTAGIDWSQIEGIGWSKIRCIASVIRPDNAEEWLQLARTLKRGDLAARVKQQRINLNRVGDPNGPEPMVAQPIRADRSHHEHRVVADIDEDAELEDRLIDLDRPTLVRLFAKVLVANGPEGMIILGEVSDLVQSMLSN